MDLFGVICIVGVIVSNGMIVRNGMIVIFCVSKIENMFCLFVVWVSFFFDRVCSMIVVDDSVRIMLIVIVLVKGLFISIVRLVRVKVVSVICILLSFSNLECIFYNVCGFSLRLIRNSIIIMLNLVKC